MPTQPKTCFNWCSCPLIPLKVAQLRAQLKLRYTELLKLFREAIWGGKDPSQEVSRLMVPFLVSTNTWYMFRKHFCSPRASSLKHGISC